MSDEMSQHLTASGEKGCEESNLSSKHYSPKVKPFFNSLERKYSTGIFTQTCQIQSFSANLCNVGYIG